MQAVPKQSHLQDAGTAGGSFNLQRPHAQLQIPSLQLLQQRVDALHPAWHGYCWLPNICRCPGNLLQDKAALGLRILHNMHIMTSFHDKLGPKEYGLTLYKSAAQA